MAVAVAVAVGLVVVVVVVVVLVVVVVRAGRVRDGMVFQHAEASSSVSSSSFGYCYLADAFADLEAFLGTIINLYFIGYSVALLQHVAGSNGHDYDLAFYRSQCRIAPACCRIEAVNMSPISAAGVGGHEARL